MHLYNSLQKVFVTKNIVSKTNKNQGKIFILAEMILPAKETVQIRYCFLNKNRLFYVLTGVIFF